MTGKAITLNIGKTPISPYERGSVMAESTFGILLFLGLIFAFMSIGVYAYRQVSLQYAVNKVMRWATIGKVSQEKFGSIIRIKVEPTGYTSSEIKDKVVFTAGQFGLDISVADIKVCPIATPQCVAGEVGSLGATGAITPSNVPTATPFIIRVRKNVSPMVATWLPKIFSYRAQAVGRSEQ